MQHFSGEDNTNWTKARSENWCLLPIFGCFFDFIHFNFIDFMYFLFYFYHSHTVLCYHCVNDNDDFLEDSAKTFRLKVTKDTEFLVGAKEVDMVLFSLLVSGFPHFLREFLLFTLRCW
jgi:hypothetical protein